jgi:hypothetical protein
MPAKKKQPDLTPDQMMAEIKRMLDTLKEASGYQQPQLTKTQHK